MWVAGAQCREAFRRREECHEMGREARNWGRNLKVDGWLWPWITGEVPEERAAPGYGKQGQVESWVYPGDPGGLKRF